MSSPTTRANNVWEANGGDDFLQLKTQQGSDLGGIDSTGTGYGSLLGGGVVTTVRFTTGPDKLVPGDTFQILAAPGAGFYWLLQNLTAMYMLGSLPYTNAADTSAFMYYGDPINNVQTMQSIQNTNLWLAPFITGDTFFSQVGLTSITGAPANFVNQPINFVVPQTNGSPIQAATPGSTPGTGYNIGDELLIFAGNDDNEITVTSVNGGGGVTGFSITLPGTGNVVGNNIPTGVQSGSGDGTFTANITQASLVGNGTIAWTANFIKVSI